MNILHGYSDSSSHSSSLWSPRGRERTIATTIVLMLFVVALAACGRPTAITTPGDEATIPTAAEEGETGQNETEQGETEQDETGPADSEAGSDEPSSGTDDSAGEEAEESVADEPALPIFNPGAVTVGLQPLVENLNRPVFVASANDGSGRLFIIEQPGVIRIFSGGALMDTPFLDIQDRVEDGGNEQGLLGLAFAPDFAESGALFINYTGQGGTTFVSRFYLAEGNPNQADRDSEFVVLSMPQPARNHNGGMVLFGPDGYLYVGTGDGGAANDRFENGQNPSSLLGKMLRIDVTSDPSQPYLIPQDNPWVNNDWTVNGEAVDVLDEIWAVGLRNPWRYSFDRATNDLWIADVGQNKWEEVNFVAATSLASQGGGPIEALNFGWPIMEASDCFSVVGNCDQSGLVLPVGEYDHSGHCSVTGGHVYRGQEYPALQGAYIYGDFCSGVVWALSADGTGGWVNTEVLKSGLNISSFGEDEAGELYLTAFNGTVYKVVLN